MVFLGSADPASNGWRNLSGLFYSVKSETDSLWSRPVLVYYNHRTLPAWPQIAIDPRGTRHVLWQEDLDWDDFPDLLLYSFSPDGKHWSSAIDLSRMGEIPFEPRMVVDSRGIAHVVWHQAELWGIGVERGVYYRFGRQNTWSEPQKIFEPRRWVHGLIIDSLDRLHLLMTSSDSLRRFVTIEYSWKDVSATEVASRGEALRTVRRGDLISLSNYPNPFNETTVFLLSLQKQATVWFRIYNTAGQLVRTLLEAGSLGPETALRWDGCDQERKPLPSGVYLCQVKAESGAEALEVVSKVLLIR